LGKFFPAFGISVFACATMAERIELQQVCPDTLPVHAQGFSQIWHSDFVFQKGEQILLTAPSGKGKSTFISLLYGLRRDYTGMFKLDGVDARTFSAARWSDVRANEMSIVFQDLRLFMEYSAIDNLRIKANLQEKDWNQERVESMAEKLGVDNLLEQKCQSLSYGERQRMAILRSLLQTADFRIMDEPFSHLDDTNAAKALELIVDVSQSQGSGLLITSLGSDYGWFYDRIVLL
jgi:ABC-type lipoprotein export system ATPase subunit